jgi:hypothetical protein
MLSYKSTKETRSVVAESHAVAKHFSICFTNVAGLSALLIGYLFSRMIHTRAS